MVELDRQQARTESGDRKLSIQAVVSDDPRRAEPLRDALHQVRPRLRPQVVHTCVRTVPGGRPDLAAAALAKMLVRRPQGVLTDLSDDPDVVEQATALMRAGIPVVTLGRPLPERASLGHSGLDQRAAGATAAYLLGRSHPTGGFAVARSETSTPVEQDRFAAFTATMDELRPDAQVTSFALEDTMSVDLREHGGVYVAAERAASATALSRIRDLAGPAATIVGHREVDAVPRTTFQTVDFALGVSWAAVVAEACRAVLAFHRQGSGRVVVAPTRPSVLTPYNLEL